MGPVEQLLRKTKVSHKKLLAAYSDRTAGRLLVGARLSLGIPFEVIDHHFDEIISEAVEAAEALSL